MNRSKYERILGILSEIRRLERQLAELLADEPLQELLPQLSSTLEDIHNRLVEEIEEQFYLALARVNFRDQHYMFIRAIDGDTVELEPPEELREWMRDVHLRLYGIDTPEKHEECGPLYTSIVEELCTGISDRRVYVIWERERPQTEYGLYPRTSFERGVGNLFIPYEGRLIYLNAILAMLPHVQIERCDKPLIRGKRFFPELRERCFWDGPCATGLPTQFQEVITRNLDLPYPHFRALPVCLASFPREILGTVESSPCQGWEIIRDSILERGCPFSQFAAHIEGDLAPMFDDRVISPFDVPLILSASWGRTSRR